MLNFSTKDCTANYPEAKASWVLFCSDLYPSCQRPRNLKSDSLTMEEMYANKSIETQLSMQCNVMQMTSIKTVTPHSTQLTSTSYTDAKSGHNSTGNSSFFTMFLQQIELASSLKALLFVFALKNTDVFCTITFKH